MRQKQPRLFWITLLCVGPLIGQAFAADHYVRALATGSGNGSDWTNAYRTLPASLTRGDTYYIADGTYGGYTFATSGTSVIAIKKATVSSHGTNTGWNDAYGDGEALFSTSGTVWTFTTGYYDIDGVVGQGKAPGAYGFRLRSTSPRSNNVNMVLFGSNNVINVALRHIDFDWNNGTPSGAAAVTRHLYSTAASDRITIEYSYFHHSSGYVFYIGPYDPSPGGAVQNHYSIRNNYFYLNGGGGSDSAHWETMWLMNVDNSNIYNNVIEDTIGSSGQTGWMMMAKANNVNVYGNLFFCSGSASTCIVGGNGVIATWSADAYQNDSVSIYNNTFANLIGVYTAQIYFAHNTVSDTNITLKNNLYYNSAFNWAGINTQSDEACGGGQSCRGTNQQTGITTSQFLSFAGRDFRLASATTSGDVSIGAQFSEDMNGATRGSDGVWDRGAFEFASGGGAIVQPPSNLRITVR